MDKIIFNSIIPWKSNNIIFKTSLYDNVERDSLFNPGTIFTLQTKYFSDGYDI